MSSFLVVPFLTSYLVANVGRDESELFWIYLCGGLATLVTMTLIGWWADRWRKLPVFRLMAFATAIPLLLLTNLPHGTGLVVVLAYTTLFFVTSSGRMVPAMAMITASATPRHRGSFLSVNTAVSHMAMGLASILAGWILSDAASGAPLIHFPLIGALGALAAIVSAILGGWIIPAPGGKDATVAVEGVPTHASVERNGEGTATAAPPDAVPA
jgi:predicted MFS family arabinose efflux permease